MHKQSRVLSSLCKYRIIHHPIFSHVKDLPSVYVYCFLCDPWALATYILLLIQSLISAAQVTLYDTNPHN